MVSEKLKTNNNIIRQWLNDEQNRLETAAKSIANDFYATRRMIRLHADIEKFGQLNIRVRKRRQGPGIEIEYYGVRFYGKKNRSYSRHTIPKGCSDTYSLAAIKSLKWLVIADWELEWFKQNEFRLAQLRKSSKALSKISRSIYFYELAKSKEKNFNYNINGEQK